jgi:hypothetical protein
MGGEREVNTKKRRIGKKKGVRKLIGAKKKIPPQKM